MTDTTDQCLRHLPVRTQKTDLVLPPVQSKAGEGAAQGAADGSEILRVLLVEDDPVYAMLVQMVLEDSTAPQFSTVHVDMLADALEQVRLHPWDVVLLDLSLPDMSGMGTVVEMRNAAENLPLVVMTGLDDSSLAAHALEQGVQDYLVKSDEPHRTVVRSILNAITRMNAQREREALHCQVAALLREVASEKARLQAELDQARKMQMAMLPTDDQQGAFLAQLGISIQAYFDPCSTIGGDLWGIFPAAGGRLGFYSFDFSGHGVGAALNVFRLHALLMEHARGCDDPAYVLTSLNRRLCSILPRGHYATMFLAIIDPATDQVCWAGAGAPSPLLMTGQQIQTLNTRGTPLGLTRQSLYENRSCSFPAGSSLFVYSDAIPEATCSGLDTMFDDDGLLDLARQTLVEAHNKSLDLFIDTFMDQVEMPLSDDLTAIWVQR